MTQITGSLSIADESIPFTQWQITAHRITDGEKVGISQVNSNGATPVAYAIDCLTETEACLVTLSPKLGAAWKPETGTGEGAYIVPTTTSAPYVYRADSVTAGADPLDGNVAFYAHLDADFVDSKGATMSVEPLTVIVLDKPVQTLDGTGSALFTSDTSVSSSGISTTTPAIDLGSDSFTIDFWCKSETPPGADQKLLFLSDASENNVISFSDDGEGSVFSVTVMTNGSFNFELTTALQHSVWNHIALVRSGSDFSLFINGIYADGAYQSLDLSGMTSLYVGRGVGTAYTRFDGQICRLRLTIGAARWANDFTPPSTFSGVAGITGATEPAWPTAIMDTVADGDVTWINAGRMVQPVSQGWLIPS